jgi:hypothetical protein
MAFMQALPMAEGLALANNILTTMQVLEQEETHRQHIQAEKEVRLAQIETGGKIMTQLVDREYDSKDLAIKSMTPVMLTMAQMGHNDAAIQLAQLLLDRTLSGEFVKQLLEFRNTHASGGMIELRVKNSTK